MYELKEKDIVNHLYNNWNKYFPDFVGCKKEYTIRDSRIDILSSYKTDLYKIGIRPENDICRFINAAVFAEVKYNNNDRDLMYELQKHIQFRNRYIECGKSYCYIMVISDGFDQYMLNFMRENDIITYQYSIEDNDLETFKIWKIF